MGTALGDELRLVRLVRGHSLKTIADQAKISTAYLQKLETGDVKSPSPNVLYAIANVLDVPYPSLMELAGYVVPGSEEASPPNVFDHALASTDLSDAERRAVAAYVALLRQQRSE